MSDLSEGESSFDEQSEVSIGNRRDIIPVNNVPALSAKLKSVKLNLDWVEKLDICVNNEESDVTTNKDDDKAENDFKREMSFYNQALCAVTKAFKRLHKLNIPTKRPSDFLAEMAKSDSHMNKVREKLLSKQTAVERREQVKALREQKKQGKKIQREVLQERKAEKKKMLNALKKTKKGKMGADALLNMKKDTAPRSDKSKKFREIRDSKYGYGGKKKGSKWNTAESSAFSGKLSGGPKNRFSKDKRPKQKKHRRRR